MSHQFRRTDTPILNMLFNYALNYLNSIASVKDELTSITEEYGALEE
jgi:hypothetical protein